MSMSMNGDNEERHLMSLQQTFEGCFFFDSEASSAHVPESGIRALTMLISEYMVAIVSIGLAIILLFRPPQNNQQEDSSYYPTESTPLTGGRSVSSSVKLTLRTPYKEMMVSFFSFHGLASLFAAIDMDTLGDASDAAQALTSSLLLGMAIMEYLVYIQFFVLIQPVWTYAYLLWTLISVVAAVLLEDAHMWIALYFAVVVLLTLILVIRQYQRAGRKPYHRLEMAAMSVYLVGILGSMFYIPVCASTAGPGCHVFCPVPSDLVSGHALLNVFLLVGVLLYGIGKIKQVQYESGLAASVTLTV